MYAIYIGLIFSSLKNIEALRRQKLNENFEETASLLRRQRLVENNGKYLTPQ